MARDEDVRRERVRGDRPGVNECVCHDNHELCFEQGIPSLMLLV